jgi:hypothetical protein
MNVRGGGGRIFLEKTAELGKFFKEYGNNEALPGKILLSSYSQN